MDVTPWMLNRGFGEMSDSHGLSSGVSCHCTQRSRCIKHLGALDASIELDFPILASPLPETLFQLHGIYSLSLRKDRQRQRQCENGRGQYESYPSFVSGDSCAKRMGGIPRFSGSVNRGLLFNHSVLCILTSTSAGSTMIGVELKIRLSAVSPTANVAAFLLFPRLCTSFPFLSSSLNTGNTSIPLRISSTLIRNTFSAPADATAANGTKRVSNIFVVGETRLRRGTRALRPSAMEQEAETARR